MPESFESLSKELPIGRNRQCMSTPKALVIFERFLSLVQHLDSSIFFTVSSESSAFLNGINFVAYVEQQFRLYVEFLGDFQDHVERRLRDSTFNVFDCSIRDVAQFGKLRLRNSFPVSVSSHVFYEAVLKINHASLWVSGTFLDIKFK